LLTTNGLRDFAASRAYYTMYYTAEAFLTVLKQIRELSTMAMGNSGDP
jgi:uncharacterized protein (UPF0332 family)